MNQSFFVIILVCVEKVDEQKKKTLNTDHMDEALKKYFWVVVDEQPHCSPLLEGDFEGRDPESHELHTLRLKFNVNVTSRLISSWICSSNRSSLLCFVLISQLKISREQWWPGQASIQNTS